MAAMKSPGALSIALFESRVASAIVVVLATASLFLVTGAGVLVAFALVLVVCLVGVRRGAFGRLGFRRPESWRRLLGWTALYGFGLQLATLVLVEPILELLTGAPVDVSSFDAVRGNAANFAVLLAVGVIVGGLIEETVFRGFIQQRTEFVLGKSRAAVGIGLLAGAVPFGLAHWYQGLSGVLSTGLLGLVFGLVYLRHDRNLWFAIGTHAMANVAGVIAIYTNADRWLLGLLW
jgi:membrane protease YdiL (CAAX protease family)